MTATRTNAGQLAFGPFALSEAAKRPSRRADAVDEHEAFARARCAVGRVREGTTQTTRGGDRFTELLRGDISLSVDTNDDFP